MKTTRLLCGPAIWFLLAVQSSQAPVTYADNFATSANNLTTGAAGTMWDGVYLGARSISNATGTDGVAPETVRISY